MGNASTFQMIPVIMGQEVPRLMPQAAGRRTAPARSRWRSGGDRRLHQAIGAYGGFFIPKAYGTSIAMTGSPVGALWLFLAFYVVCLAITWVVYTRPGGLLHDIEHGRGATPPPSPPNDRTHLGRRMRRPDTDTRKDSPMSHLLDRLNFFQSKELEQFSDGYGPDHAREPRLGGHLPEPLAARQDRALDPWGELHRVVFVEDLRQVRHRDLGNPADRLSPHPRGPAQPRTARLRAGRVLQLVSLFAPTA